MDSGSDDGGVASPRGARCHGGTSRGQGGCKKIEFLSSIAVIAPDPPASRKLYVDTLGLPLEGDGDDAYQHTAPVLHNHT